MTEKEKKYQEMFLAEAFESQEELNNLFVQFEKDHDNEDTIETIFRITHTMKGNAMGLGYDGIAKLSHLLEEIFGHIKQKNITVDQELYDGLFKANDKLQQLLFGLKDDKKVTYQGIKTKLEVMLKKKLEDSNGNEGEKEEAPPSPSAPVEDTAAEEATPESEVKEEADTEDKKSTIVFSDQISIPISKLDGLLNLVGELIIEKDSIIAKNNGSSGHNFSMLHRITSDLQYGIMNIRLIQVGFLFNKFNRVIRDVSAIEQKEVELELEGTNIEIDRNILKIMSDSLVHLVRNAVSHGIESKEERAKTNKKQKGKVYLRAKNEKDTVIIEVSDDGAGIDAEKIKKKAIEKNVISKEIAEQMNKHEILNCVFEPGFSTSDEVTAVSGRGVGMDVVKRAAESIGGRVEISSELGKGTTTTMFLPSSMAVKGALLFNLFDQVFAVALSYTEAVVSYNKEQIRKTSSGLITSYLNKPISLIFIRDIFQMEDQSMDQKIDTRYTRFDQLPEDKKIDTLIVNHNNKMFGLVVDKFLQQKEIVEKKLEKPLDSNPLLSGATIMGNGNVCLVMDVASISNILSKELIREKVVL